MASTTRPNSQIVVGDRRVRRRRPRARARRVIVGQTQQHELRQLLAVAVLARLHEAGKLAQKLIGAKLIGIFEFEVGVVGIEVSPQFRLGRRVVRDQGNRVFVGALASAQLRGQVFSGLDLFARAIRRMLRGSAAGLPDCLSAGPRTTWWPRTRRSGGRSDCAAPGCPRDIRWRGR